MATKKQRKNADDDDLDVNEAEFTITENDGVCALVIGGRTVVKRRRAGSYDAILAFARKQLNG